MTQPRHAFSIRVDAVNECFNVSKMRIMIVLLFSVATANELECIGQAFFNVSLSAYFPEYEEELSPTGAVDADGNELHTLQDYLDDRSEYVTMAMDETLRVPYGTVVCVPELNTHFRRRIRFLVCDSGSHLRGKKYRRADVCVRDEADSYDRAVNILATLVF